LNAIPVVTVDQLTVGSVEFTLRDGTTGEAIDLADTYGIQNSEGESSSSPDPEGGKQGVELWAKELPTDATPYFHKDLKIVDAANGLVALEYEENETRFAGIWVSTAVVFDKGKRRRLFPLQYVVNPTMDTLNACFIGTQMLTIAEIRLLLRDVCPESNHLLDEIEFTDTEIAFMIRHHVDQWNETPPVVRRFTSATFPHRYTLAIAVIGKLHLTAEYHKRRNDLDYNAGGLSVQETADHARYEAIGQARLNEWKEFMRQRKYADNIDWTLTLGSGYRFGNSER
jgi:hypothetical protein